MILALLLACVGPVPALKVVVVVTDTVRADLGGAPRPEWLEGGREYVNAYSAAPYTTASTAALVTGRLPTGQERAWPAGGPPPCDGPDERQPQRVPWPADAWPELLLMDQPVPAMMAGRPLHPFNGPGSELLFAQATTALDDGAAAIYVHSKGAHDPYDGLQQGKRSPESQALHRAMHCQEPSEEITGWARREYPRGVQKAFTGLPEFIAAARASGAVVIWTADHGEALGEDGLWGHGTGLHDAQVHVPLYVWGPGVVHGEDPTPIPATCVGQTARVALGDNTPELCDLRDGTIRGDVVAGMLLADGTWDERVILDPVAATP